MPFAAILALLLSATGVVPALAWSDRIVVACIGATAPEASATPHRDLAALDFTLDLVGTREVRFMLLSRVETGTAHADGVRHVYDADPGEPRGVEILFDEESGRPTEFVVSQPSLRLKVGDIQAGDTKAYAAEIPGGVCYVATVEPR